MDFFSSLLKRRPLNVFKLLNEPLRLLEYLLLVLVLHEPYGPVYGEPPALRDLPVVHKYVPANMLHEEEINDLEKPSEPPVLPHGEKILDVVYHLEDFTVEPGFLLHLPVSGPRYVLTLLDKPLGEPPELPALDGYEGHLHGLAPGPEYNAPGGYLTLRFQEGSR